MSDDLFPTLGDGSEFDEAVDQSTKAPEGAEELVRRAYDHIASARRVPMSASVMVDRDELLDLLQGALESLPDELRRARWLLREQDEIMAERRREADALMDDVRAQAERMVQRTEIVRQANHVAQRILDDARAEARRLRHEAEDYCDKKLAAFEIVLERTLKTVQAGREHLAQTPAPASSADDNSGHGAPGATQGAGGTLSGDEAPFFDQDEP